MISQLPEKPNPKASSDLRYIQDFRQVSQYMIFLAM